MKAHYHQLFAYDAWANYLFLTSLKPGTTAGTRACLLMSHILSAKDIWLSRVQNQPSQIDKLWKEYHPEELLPLAERLEMAWKEHLENLSFAEFSLPVRYRNSKGEQFSTLLKDILSHLINHGTYHRAQIAALFVQEGIKPPVTDFIAYVRENTH